MAQYNMGEQEDILTHVAVVLELQRCIWSVERELAWSSPQ